MQSWAEEELQHAQLGDKRLNKRLIRLVKDLSSQPSASVPQACGSWAATKAAYRFWKSDNVEADDIRKAHQERTVERLRGESMVLMIQDTTELDFTHHPSTKELGHLDHPSLRGLKVHSGLTVSTQGVPLGLIHQEVWVRDTEDIGKKHRRKKRETKEKESQRWLTALSKGQDAIPEGIEVITIADREADIYDLFAAPRRRGSHLLVRAAYNRRVKHPDRYLWDAIEKSPPQGQLTIDLRRMDDKPPRKATLTVRFMTLEIEPPCNRPKRASFKSIPLQVILAREENPPPGVTPIYWLLITTLPVDSFEDALQCVKWYSHRWLVERYHHVLKSGCHIEQLQLEKADRIKRALATYCIVAWRLLWLTYESRKNPDRPCDEILESHEWQSLYCVIHKTPTPPQTPPTLRQTVRWIAQLGGFLGRKSDGEPGVKTTWRGLIRLHDISDTWKILHPPLPP